MVSIIIKNVFFSFFFIFLGVSLTNGYELHIFSYSKKEFLFLSLLFASIFFIFLHFDNKFQPYKETILNFFKNFFPVYHVLFLSALAFLGLLAVFEFHTDVILAFSICAVIEEQGPYRLFIMTCFTLVAKTKYRYLLKGLFLLFRPSSLWDDVLQKKKDILVLSMRENEQRMIPRLPGSSIQGGQEGQKLSEKELYEILEGSGVAGLPERDSGPSTQRPPAEIFLSREDLLALLGFHGVPLSGEMREGGMERGFGNQRGAPMEVPGMLALPPSGEGLEGSTGRRVRARLSAPAIPVELPRIAFPPIYQEVPGEELPLELDDLLEQQLKSDMQNIRDPNFPSTEKEKLILDRFSSPNEKIRKWVQNEYKYSQPALVEEKRDYYSNDFCSAQAVEEESACLAKLHEENSFFRARVEQLKSKINNVIEKKTREKTDGDYTHHGDAYNWDTSQVLRALAAYSRETGKHAYISLKEFATTDKESNQEALYKVAVGCLKADKERLVFAFHFEYGSNLNYQGFVRAIQEKLEGKRFRNRAHGTFTEDEIKKRVCWWIHREQVHPGYILNGRWETLTVRGWNKLLDKDTFPKDARGPHIIEVLNSRS